MKIESIKFKAKRLGNGEWVCGDLLHRITDICIAVKDMDDIVYYPVDPATVCQFTGLKDCEGKEIWEGDILEGESKYEIVFFKGTFATRFINYNGKECVDPLHYFIKEDGTVECKVVGNKFDKVKRRR